MPGPVKGSPRSPSLRPQVAVRMSPPGIEAVDALATTWAVQRSTVIRALLTAALADPATLRRARDLAHRTRETP